MEVFSLPLHIWTQVVECLSRSDIHNCVLVSKTANDVVHQVQPAAWRSLSLKPTSLDLELLTTLQPKRYRSVTSLTIKGVWNGEFLAGVLKLVNKELRDLELDTPPSDWTTEGACELLHQIGPSLRKLVLGYSLFVAEPTLPTIIAESCPNLVHLEMRSPPLGHGVNQQFPIPPTLPSLCPNINTFGWVCYPSLATKFELAPISGMRKLRVLLLSNLSILDNHMFTTHIINSGLPLVTLELTLPHTFQHQGLCSFAPLAATLKTLRLYNCSYNLRPMQLNLLPNLRTVAYYTSLRECDFETVDILTSLPLDTLEIRFQSSLRSIQLRERFVQLMAKKPYRLITRGTLYDTFCYTICSS